MPVQSKAELLEQLTEATKRMLEVRDAAARLRLIRRGEEPSPGRGIGALGQPAAGFLGQPERTDVTR